MSKLSLFFVALAFLGVKCTFAQNYTGPLPSTDVNLMAYYYYSSASPNGSTIQFNNSDTIVSSGFNTALETIILIDGFLSNFTNSMMTQGIKDALLEINYTGNIIIVDWGALSGGTSCLLYSSLTTSAALLLYPFVVFNTPAVGQRLGQFIQFLGVPSSSVRIIGHSEGAHAAGIAGKYYQNQTSTKFLQITGLDPAGPLYLYLSVAIAQSLQYCLLQTNQLNPTDATRVDNYHSGRGSSVLGKATDTGFGTSGTMTGTVDVFINGGNGVTGNGQPGCNQTSSNSTIAAIANAYCNHKYSWEFYIRTILSPSTYQGCTCTPGSILGLLGSCVCGTQLLNLCPAFPITCTGSGVVVGYGMNVNTAGYYYVADTTLAY